MNSKIAKLLSENLVNEKVVEEMIMYICNRDSHIEDHLIDLCLATDAQLVTKEMIMKVSKKIHLDTIYLLEGKD